MYKLNKMEDKINTALEMREVKDEWYSSYNCCIVKLPNSGVLPQPFGYIYRFSWSECLASAP